jgi:hypothetical protein
MSSTLNAKREGDDAIDDFQTPPWAIECMKDHLVRMLTPHAARLKAGFTKSLRPQILEPAVGEGNIVRVCRTLGDWHGCDVRDVLAQDVRADVKMVRGSFLDPSTLAALAPPPGGYDMVITNPPYSLAMEFLRRSLELIHDDGWVVFLLRVGFLQALERHEFMIGHVPDQHTLGKRPSYDKPHPPKCTVWECFSCGIAGRRKYWGVPTEARDDDGDAMCPQCHATGSLLSIVTLRHDFQRTAKGERKFCTQCGVKQKGQDSATYAWMAWRKGVRTVGHHFILPLPPSMLKGAES